MIPEGLNYNSTDNRDADVAGTSAIILEKTGANAIKGMMLSEQRISEWEKQQQAMQQAKQQAINKKVKDLNIDTKNIFDADVPYFVAQKQKLEGLVAQSFMQGEDPFDPRSKSYLPVKNLQSQIESEVQASIQHKNNFVEKSSLLAKDGSKGTEPRYNYQESAIEMDAYHQKSLPERMKADQNLLKTAEFDMDGYIRDELLAVDKKSGLNKFQEQTADVVHEKGTDFIETKVTYGKDLSGPREYEYKEEGGKYFKHMKGAPEEGKDKDSGWKPITKTTYDFETQRASNSVFDKYPTPEGLVDATEFAINSKPQFKNRVYSEYSQISNTPPNDPNYDQNMAIKKVFEDSAAAKSAATGRLITPEVLYGAVHYLLPMAQEKVSIDELRENAGAQAYSKEDAKLKAKMNAIQPIANSTVDMLRSIWTGQDNVYDKDASGNKYTPYLTGKQWGPMADGKTVDNAVSLVIHTTTADGEPLMLIKTPQSQKSALAANISLMKPIETQINALTAELASPTTPAQRKQVIQEILVAKNADLARLAKAPGSGFMQVTDMGVAVQNIISGQPQYAKDAGTLVSLANEYGAKNGWFDKKTGTWSGVKTAKGQDYKNLTLENAKTRLSEVKSKVAENEAKYKALGVYAEYSDPQNPKYSATKTNIAKGVMQENKALLQEESKLVQTIGVNSSTESKKPVTVPTTIKTQSEYEKWFKALPSGTVFIDPSTNKPARKK